MELKTRVRRAWAIYTEALRQFGRGTSATPKPLEEVFRFRQDGDVLTVDVLGVVLSLPSRANAGQADMFVTLDGSISLEPDDAGSLHTVRYVTHVGYFKRETDGVVHTLGLHYDFDDKRLGHPIFHAQVASMSEMWSRARGVLRTPATSTDLLEHVFGHARIPTAQMDPFSVLLQLAADHLLWEKSPRAEIAQFVRVREAVTFFSCASKRSPEFFRSGGCHRSVHWYR